MEKTTFYQIWVLQSYTQIKRCIVYSLFVYYFQMYWIDFHKFDGNIWTWRQESSCICVIPAASKGLKSRKLYFLNPL